MAGQLGFFGEGFREIGRKFKRSRLRSQQARLAKQRQEALTQLGQRSWELQTDLSAFPELRNQLQQLQQRAGELAATTGRLEGERVRLQTQKAAEIARFDALCQPVRARKTEAEAAFRAARSRLSDTDRSIGAIQNRLSRLTVELGKAEQGPPAGAQSQREALVCEQKTLSDQLTAAMPAREVAAGEVAALDAEARRCDEELSRLDAERKAALAPIDAEVNRVQKETQGASRDSSTVGKEQTARLSQLGAAIYDRGIAAPGLAEPIQGVRQIDEVRAKTGSEIAASLALTTAMPRWTMLKFVAVPTLSLVFAVGAVLVVFSLLMPTASTRISRGGSPTGATRSARMQTVDVQESRKDALIQVFLESPREEPSHRAAIEILEADLMAVGSSANRAYLPHLLKILQKGEPRLRAAASQAIGMVKPSPAEVPALVEALNDPIREVRDGALTALGQVRNDVRTRLLIRRMQASERTGSRTGARFEPDPVPDPERLGVAIYPGARFLYGASDLGFGRAAFTSQDPLPKVLDFYTSKAGRPAMTGEDFTRTYLGGSSADPTGAQRISADLEAWFKQATASGKSESEIRAGIERRTARVENLPLVRYADQQLYGSPSFVAIEETGSADSRKVVRFVAIFQDLALGRTGFEVHVVQ